MTRFARGRSCRRQGPTGPDADPARPMARSLPAKEDQLSLEDFINSAAAITDGNSIGQGPRERAARDPAWRKGRLK
ncbi:hypothetical protein GCM10022403_005320 [Streptomyces coacervatus]|uniref:Uncharacterized protein n=1 Tax=Streptomyces coacervatus TaxID=647381 RepID=A0ABP7GUZ0_9ACTN